MTTSTPSTSRRWTNGLLIGLVVVLVAFPLLVIRGSEFGGADDAAEKAIGVIVPGYEPWFTPLWEPPGGEIESLLFSLQAALGAAVIGYFFGLKRGQRQVAKGPRAEDQGPAHVNT